MVIDECLNFLVGGLFKKRQQTQKNFQGSASVFPTHSEIFEFAKDIKKQSFMHPVFFSPRK
jgi:hypothetical protein